jgi:hypothetical protein
MNTHPFEFGTYQFCGRRSHLARALSLMSAEPARAVGASSGDLLLLSGAPLELAGRAIVAGISLRAVRRFLRRRELRDSTTRCTPCVRACRLAFTRS